MSGTNDTLRLLLAGLAAGDSLGATSEFSSQASIPALYRRLKPKGWPFKQVGGGAFNWKPGEPTDDTAMAWAIVRTTLEREAFDPEAIGVAFVAWLRSGPSDVGGLTRRTVSSLARGVPWHEAGFEAFAQNPQNSPNGSLMRNGIIPASAESMAQAFEHSLKQGIITHYDPLSVLCCGVQTWMIWRLLHEAQRPLFDHNGWLREFGDTWDEWVRASGDIHVQRWHARVQESTAEAWSRLTGADFDPHSFDPYRIRFGSSGGYSLLTLQIAVWALHWSLMDEAFPVPAGFPAEVFDRRGPWVLGWVAMIGNDSDTYGATAGPLLAAAHGGLPVGLTDGLKVLQELDRIQGHAVRSA